jgi:hypothetical protein
MKTTASTTRTMANQCRAANRRARPPEGLVSGTPLDMTRTIVRRRVFTGTFRYQFAFGLSHACRQMSAPQAPHCPRSQRARHKRHPRRSRSSPNRHRKANPSSRRHGLLVAAAESEAPSTKPRAKNRAPGQTSSCVERRGHVPFDERKAALIRCARHRFVAQVVGVDLFGGCRQFSPCVSRKARGHDGIATRFGMLVAQRSARRFVSETSHVFGQRCDLSVLRTSKPAQIMS